VKHTDAAPYVKIVSASEEPLVEESDGIVTISTQYCIDGPTTTSPPGSAPSEDESSAFALSAMTGLFAFARPSVGTLLMLAASLPTAFGQAEFCKPSLEIEIGMPSGSMTTEKFGETDHELKATVETVTWGYYDPNATAAITMQSGETITVEVITHHSGHDYAKMIRGDPAIEEIFYWEETQTLESKPEPKLAGSGVHLVTGPIEVEGAMPGDVIQVDILELDPRPNPDGRTFGTNSQKFAGYQFRVSVLTCFACCIQI
jgi:hypothetical protein